MAISIKQLGATNNFAEVTIGTVDLYFSYVTLVAYRDPEDGLVVHENDWSPTTGKHLKDIDGGKKDDRLPDGEFEAKVAAMLKRHGLDAY